MIAEVHAPGESARSPVAQRSDSFSTLALLTLILLLAAVLRLYALPQRGLMYWDEAKFALEGIRLHNLIGHLLGAHGSIVAGKAIGTAKPTHALLIAIALVFTTPEFAPLVLNAFASVLQVGALYFIGRNLFGTPIALLSSLLMAVSEYDVMYARSGLSESDGNLLLTCGVLVWLAAVKRVAARDSAPGDEPGFQVLRTWAPRAAGSGRDSTSRLLLAGLLFGVAFTTNYRLVIYIASIIAFDVVWAWRCAGWRIALRHVPLWATGLAVAPVLWQLVDLVTRASGRVLFRNELTGEPRFYVNQVIYQLHEGRQSALHFDPLAYIHWLELRQGIPVFILLVVGIVIALWKRTFPWLAITVPVVLPYVSYTFAPFIVPRNLAAALPFASVLAAAGLVTLTSWLASLSARGAWRGAPPRGGRVATALLLLATLLLGALGTRMSWRLTAERSGYARAAQYVERHGNGRALVTNEVMVFYLRGSGRYCHAPYLRGDPARLTADIRTGYQYAVLDHFSYRLSRLVRDHMPRVAGYSTVGTASLGENPLNSEHYPMGKKYSLDDVDVIRLESVRLPTVPRTRPDVCNRERV